MNERKDECKPQLLPFLYPFLLHPWLGIFILLLDQLRRTGVNKRQEQRRVDKELAHIREKVSLVVILFLLSLSLLLFFSHLMFNIFSPVKQRQFTAQRISGYDKKKYVWKLIYM